MSDSLDTVEAGAEQTGGACTLVGFDDVEGAAVPMHVNERADM